jgi:hypothetical protein
LSFEESTYQLRQQKLREIEALGQQLVGAFFEGHCFLPASRKLLIINNEIQMQRDKPVPAMPDLER